MEQPKQEICTIQIMFPVVSDEEAIKSKRKIEEVLAGNSEAQIKFTLMNVSSKPPIA